MPAYATTITVTKTNDSGPGTLRQALADVQDGDTIEFNFGGAATISLTSDELVINKNITVNGPGANLLTIARAQGAVNFRVFHVRPTHTVTIQGVTISNGSGQGFAIGGAGIWNDHSNLTVNDCVLTATQLTAESAAAASPMTQGMPGGRHLRSTTALLVKTTTAPAAPPTLAVVFTTTESMAMRP
jgi:hypothetical protein